MTGEPLRSPPFAYLDRWSVRAGEQLHLKASSAEDYTVRVVRLVHADVSADGPGRIEEEQSWCEVSEHPALEQKVLLGSFASSTALPALSEAEVISVSCLALTRLPAAGARQTVLALVSRHGEPWLSVGLGPKGEPLARVATPRGLVQVGPAGPSYHRPPGSPSVPGSTWPPTKPYLKLGGLSSQAPGREILTTKPVSSIRPRSSWANTTLTNSARPGRSVWSWPL